MTMYTLRVTEKRYPGFSLTIKNCCLEDNTIYAVTGPNGSGKTTFLNLLSLIERPSKGDVVFNGETVDHGSSHELLRQRRRIGYLMQNPYLFNMSVYDNISYGLRIRKMPEAEIRERVERIMERLMLAGLSKRNAHALSGGEAQRVAVARTLVLDADVYLLDEPTANVDQQNIHVVEELVHQLNEQKKATVVFSTHSADQAYRISKNIISIVGGEIRDVGYENVFIGFLREKADGGKAVKLSEQVEIRISEGSPGRVIIAVDPQHILLSSDELESSALNKFKGVITKIVDTNGSLRVFVDVGITFCALITRKSYHDMGLNIGKDVWVTFKANAVKVIDRQ